MEALQNFIDKYVQLSNFRGIDAQNPVDFVIQPEAQSSTTWMLIVSYSEPTFARVPYNVLWIPMNSNDPNYRKVMRRADHETQNFAYRSLWDEVLEGADLFTEEQYFAPVIEDLALYGIIDPNSGIPNASTSALGVVRLQPNPDNTQETTYPAVQPIAIEADDPRMSDDRYPNQHGHPDYPRTMIKINDIQYARVNKSFPPQPGMLLMLEEQNPDNANEFLAIWRYPQERDVSFVDRSLVQLEIRGDTSMLEQTSKTYEVWGIFADGQQRQVVPATFAVTQNPTAATLNPTTGVLTAENISNNETIRMEASYTERGITRTAFLDVQIIAGAELESIEIVGPTTVESGSSTPYTVEATFAGGQIISVTPNVFTSDNTDLTSLTGLTLVVEETFAGGVTQLFASYTFDGTTATDTHDVTISAAQIIPVELEILGATSIQEDATETYTFHVTYNDGTEDTLTTVNTFRTEPSGNINVTLNGSGVTVNHITQNASVTLFASFTANGTTVTDTHVVSLVNIIDPVGLIVEKWTADQDGSVRSQATVQLDNNGTAGAHTFVGNLTWSVADETYASLNPSATISNSTISAPVSQNGAQQEATFPFKRIVALSASKTFDERGGVIFEGERNIFVSPPTLVSAKLVPIGENPSTYPVASDYSREYDEGTAIQLNLWYEIFNGTSNVWKKHIPEARPSVPLTWGRENIARYRGIPTTGETTTNINGFISGVDTLPEIIVVNASAVSSDTEADFRIELAYSRVSNSTPNFEENIPFNFTIRDVPDVVTLTALRIRVVGGPDSSASTHTEDQTLQLRYEATFSDAPSTWIDVTSGAGTDLTAVVRAPANGVTLSANLVDLTLPDVSGNQTSIVDAEFTVDGISQTASYTVTITDENAPVLPTALRIRVVGGPTANSSSHDEETAIQLRYEATYNDAPSTWIDVTANSGLTAQLNAPVHGSVLNANKIDLTLGSVTQNQSLSIGASLTENGQTVNATYVVNIVDTTVYLNSIRVRLASAPNAGTNSSMQDEDQTIGLVYQADYTDSVGTFVDITGNANLVVALGSPNHGAVLQNGNTEVVLPDVTGNQTLVINAEYTEAGITRNGSYTITIRDNTITVVGFRVRMASAPTAAQNSSTVNEDQTIPVVYQAQFSNAPSTWVDVTNDNRVTAALIAPTNGSTLSGKTQVVIPDVSANFALTLRGSFNDAGNIITADYIFNVVNVVVTPLELRIRLASNPTAGTNTSTHDELTTVVMINQARFSNAPGTWVNVNSDPDLTVQIAAPTLGATLTNKTNVGLPDVNSNQSIVLNSSLTKNGTTVNANYTINITDISAPVGITPRFGTAPQQAFVADYGTPAFYDLLTGTLTGVSPEVVTTGPSNDQTQMAYFMYPASWGFLYIVEQGGFPGGWDGGKITTQDGSFGSPAEVTVGGVLYYIYRNTFPYGAGNRTWNITYGSSSPDSGTP